MKQQYMVVIGAGESGVGAAILARKLGMEVFVTDMGHIKPQYQAQLEAEGIPYESCHHTEERILRADMVVKSPGVPPTAPLIQQLTAKGTPILSEIEFAGLHTDATMICITGSNGKTTTTLLTYHILKAAGVDVGLAGNVGKSLALQVAREPHKVYVIELSSFQLENMYRFHAHVAMVLNVTPDHMDRYQHSMQLYTEAKWRILQNMTPEDYFIYWQDDPIIQAQLQRAPTPAQHLPFADHKEPGTAAYVAEGELHVDTPVEDMSMPREALSLPGIHNLHNSMAAALAACVMKVPQEVIKRSLSDFPGVEHRLETVCDVDGVTYINDSKATNVDSTFYALGAMTRPTVLILGGKDKGNDYSAIDALVRQHVKAIVAMGLHNEPIVEHFTGMVPLVSTNNLADALAECRRMAREGDVVLLSPCCASFDLFNSYEDRGDQFKAAVKAML